LIIKCNKEDKRARVPEKDGRKKKATFLEQATAKSNPDEVAWSEMNTYQNRHSNGIIPTAHMTIKTEKNIFKQMGRTSGVWRAKVVSFQNTHTRSHLTSSTTAIARLESLRNSTRGEL